MKITDIITEAASPAQQAAIAISMKKAGKKPKQGMSEGYQLDEGAIETITALAKKIPGIGKYYQMAQQYKPQLIEILKTSKSGKEVKQKMEQLAAGQSATVTESGMMKQLGGLAVGGGSILSTMWMNAMGLIDGVLAHAAAGEVGGAVASGSILGLIPVTLMLFAAMLLFKGSNQSSDEKAQAFQAQRRQQGMAEDQLDELSPATLSSYARKAKGQAGWAAGVATAAPGYKDQLTRGGEVVRQQHIVPGSEADQYDKLAKRRYAGARQAVGKGANVNPGNVEPYDWAKQGGYGDANNPAMRKRGMAENTELDAMLKHAGVAVSESRIHENSEYTYEKVAKILARETPGLATDKSSKEFYSAVYHELIAIGMTPKAARNLISYDEDFMSDVASAYTHYQSNPGLDEDNVSMMPEGDPIATFEVMPDLSNPVTESSCNATMEGEYCPEHGLAECGMYEMGTVAGSVAPMMEDQDALLARIKTLALIK